MSTPGEPSDMSGAGDDRLRRIESVTDAALAHLAVEDFLVELLDRVRELLAVDTATVLLLDSSSQQLVATAARGIDVAVRQGIRIPMGKGFAGRIAAEKQRIVLELIVPLDSPTRRLVELSGFESLAALRPRSH